MQQSINWQAFTHEERNKCIERVKDAISNSSGWIVNFNMFSDLAMSLNIEIEENGIAELYESLSKILQLSDVDLKSWSSESKKEWMLLLNISFGKGKGNLKMNIPDVPG